MREALEAVLEKFRSGYQRIPIRPETCVECLLPEDLVATILKREFATVMPDLVRVDVRLVKDAAHV